MESLTAGRRPWAALPAGRLWPLPILVLAFGLRLYGLQARPLWYDEAFAVLFAQKGFRAMLAGTLTPVQGAASDVHPIAYYTALGGWMRVAGDTPFAVRALSALVGLLTVAVVYAIGRRLFRGGAAIAAGLIAAASPFHVYHSQEARMYAPLALACALAVLFYLRAAANPAGGGSRTRAVWLWLGVSISAAAAMYMQNLAAFFLLAFGLSTLARPSEFARVAAAGAGALLLWLPWLLQLPGQLAKLRQAYWVTQPDFVTLLQTALIYHVGEEAVAAQAGLGLALFAALCLPLMLMVHLWSSAGRPGWGRASAGSGGGAGRAAWLAWLAGGPPLLLFAASLYQPVYVQRALLPAALMYALALGWLLTQSAAPAAIRGAMGALLCGVAIVGLWAHYTFAQFPRPDFPAATGYLRENAGDGDVILHSNKLTFFPMHYYDRRLPQKFLADPPGSGSDTLALPTQAVLGLYAVETPAEAAGAAGRVWFVIFDRALDEYRPNPHPHLAWFNANYAVVGVTHFDDMAVYEFLRR